MIYLQLFWVFFKIGLFGFGGGYTMVSMIRMEVVDNYTWMNAAQYADLLALSQMTPGPISINAATYVGFTQAGVLGSILATMSLCLPSVLLMGIVTALFFKHKESPFVKKPMEIMTPVVAGLIIAAALLMCDKESFTSVLSFIIFAGTAAVHYFFKTNPILLIIIAGVLGWLNGIFFPVQ
ncbi:MAG: chromate transporter [Bacteroidales bacterium]|nr:chromate transporter [Bacteroidales bacterium]